jgi:hypothetical protein
LARGAAIQSALGWKCRRKVYAKERRCADEHADQKGD